MQITNLYYVLLIKTMTQFYTFYAIVSSEEKLLDGGRRISH